MKNNKNSLTEKDFEEIASKTEMFSGSDISVLVRDAIYEPVRRLQSATEFKEMNGRFLPCREGEKGDVKGTWVSLPNDKIDIEDTSKADFDYALTRTKPSVDKKQLKEHEDFTKNFGQEGWGKLSSLLFKFYFIAYDIWWFKHWKVHFMKIHASIWWVNMLFKDNRKSLASVADRFVDMLDFEHDIAITEFGIVLVSNKLKLDIFINFFKNVPLDLLKVNLTVDHAKSTMVVLDIIVINFDISFLSWGASFGDLRVFGFAELRLAAGVADSDADLVGEGDLLLLC